MTPVPPASLSDLRAQLLARLDDIRRVLTQAANSLSDDQRAEARRLLEALEALDRRIRDSLPE